MPLNGTQAANQVKTFLQGLTFRQKITIVLSAGAVAVALWGFVFLLGKANYKTLYSGLSPAESQALTRRLAVKKIPFELSSDGTSVHVPASQLDQARLEMASQGMPQSGRLGFELFDKPNWSGSDFAEQVNYQRALEGELERTIQTMGEVAAARVHLVMPHDSLFTEQARAAKAAVVIKLRSGRLSDEAQEAITHLVASAVDNLKPEDVTLIDADGGMPILAQGRTGMGISQRRADLETSLAHKLVATLEPVVGLGKVRANVTVEYDLATSDSMQETYDPNATAVLTSQLSTEKVSNTDAEGVPGTASNVPGEQSTSGAEVSSGSAGESQGLHTENKTFAVSKTVRHITQPSGGVKRITAALLVDDATEAKQEDGKQVETRRMRTPEEMKQIQELAMAAIGFDPNRGDRLAVENLSFQTLPFEKPQKPSFSDRLVPVMEKWLTVIRYLALLLLFGLVYLLVLRPIKNQIVTTFRELPKQLGAGKKDGATLKGESEGESKGEEALSVEIPLQRELAEAGSEVKQAVTLKRHLVEKVKKEPEAASRLIQNWVRQEIKL